MQCPRLRASQPDRRPIDMTENPRPTRQELVAGCGDVLHDLPTFLTAPLCRRWHLRWGATPAEVAESLPGDTLVPGAQYRTTRAIRIEAPPEAVWPGLVQVGCLRAGFYSNDLLDNLGHPRRRAGHVGDLRRLPTSGPSGPDRVLRP